jgi:2-epi-5-epi-valiolone synthase
MTGTVENPDVQFRYEVPGVWQFGVELTSAVFDPENPTLAQRCDGRQAIFFVSPTIDSLYGAQLRAYLQHRLALSGSSYVVLESGEKSKNMRSVELICEYAKSLRLDRNGVMVAVGGGIICDMVGFAASIYKRGVRYIKVNTTLVGQIDVGVGVKTGVNFLHSKNLLGSYYPAFASINDPLLLRTLPRRQISCGLAEIIKIAIVASSELFELLEAHVESILARGFGARAAAAGADDWRVLVLAIQLMMDELRPNLLEKDLARLVDFGHSFSQVIEVESGYTFHHGEAVAMDMALSSRLAVRLGRLREQDCDRIMALLLASGLPLADSSLCVPDLMMLALRDVHLHRGRQINLVIPTAIGRADFLRTLEDVPPEVLQQACHDVCGQRVRRLERAAERFHSADLGGMQSIAHGR